VRRIPVVDLFAGPGGLGEGFSALRHKGRPVFKIGISIEKDIFAHRTLELRAFFRQFADGRAPQDYYSYLRGNLSREELFQLHPAEAAAASAEAWHAELGSRDYPPSEIDRKIRNVLGHERNWVLIGGPPCQAYSLVGRSRRKNDPTFATDEKHLLYRQYLRILAEHRPPVFVMENVKGLLSAKVQEEGILDKILSDLENPLDAIYGRGHRRGNLNYRLVSLVATSTNMPHRCDPRDFVVRAEDYGIPQARHRIILLGVLADGHTRPGLLVPQPQVSIDDVIGDLPPLRSGVSKEPDSPEAWRGIVLGIAGAEWLRDRKVDETLRQEIHSLLNAVASSLGRGGAFLPPSRRAVRRHRDWFFDERLAGICNHETRSHIRADLHRYFFVAAFARVHERSPLLDDFPKMLLPKHENVAAALQEAKFNDRFRVQSMGRPSTTVTSHISKDGHYFIHYDPTQCRSLTVREAARLQTFPDNYFFEGPRTQQYHQVGNAVPPLLARQIARIVQDCFSSVKPPKFAKNPQGAFS